VAHATAKERCCHSGRAVARDRRSCGGDCEDGEVTDPIDLAVLTLAFVAVVFVTRRRRRPDYGRAIAHALVRVTAEAEARRYLDKSAMN
jgi:hypothetical protein